MKRADPPSADPRSSDPRPGALPPDMPGDTPSRFRRRLFNGLGLAALAIGSVGIVLPLLPTVPFYILAAYWFGKGNPAFERRLLDHRVFGPHIRAWRAHGAISRRGKIAALAMLSASAIASLLLLDRPWSLVPAAALLLTGTWIATRPSA